MASEQERMDEPRQTDGGKPGQTDKGNKFVYFPTTGRGLRKSELQLLIPNRLRTFAFNVCEKEARAYDDCVAGWGSFRALYKCREKKRIMENCVAIIADDPDAWEAVKERYLIDREVYTEFVERQGKKRAAEVEELKRKAAEEAARSSSK